MPYQIVRNDITKMSVDAIVNTANIHPVIGRGVDSLIHQKAGPQLLAVRKVLGDIPLGDAAITPAFNLDAKYVIHAVTPLWEGGKSGEVEVLRRAYDRCLQLAVESGCESIAFPLLSAGNLGFPTSIALETAMNAFTAFLLEHEILIYLVVFDKTAMLLSEKLFSDVQSFIDENYVAEIHSSRPRFASRREAHLSSILEQSVNAIPAPSARPKKLEELLEKTDASFAETLFMLIDASGKKDSEIYNAANVDRKHFNKIKNIPGYRPGKPTAVALAMALHLEWPEFCDLLGRAGYSMTHSSKFDIIVEYYVQNRNYNLFELNEVLYQFDQPLVGS